MARHDDETPGLHRRDLLGLATGALLASVLGGRASRAQDAPGAFRIRAVQVDVTPLAALGQRSTAGLIQQVLPEKLREQFADSLSPGDARAPVLVARIDRLYLSLLGDTPSPGFDSLSSTDSMEGAGLLLAGRQVLSSTPLRVSLPGSYSGAYYLPDIDQRRVASLCESFASWLRRDFPS